jgi:hypothetical protein
MSTIRKLCGDDVAARDGIVGSGGARSAQKSGGSQAAAGDTKQPQSGQKQQE